jgi:hypothetical protein
MAIVVVNLLDRESMGYLGEIQTDATHSKNAERHG